MTKDVLVNISGLQMAVDDLGNEDGPIEIITPGTYYFKDGNHYIFMEEVAEGMKLFQMTMVIGAYLGIGLCIVLMMGGDNQVFTIVCSLIPISAPFVVPACLLIGKISLGIALVSLVLLLVITALLFSFTAKVYESMIFYNGSVMKLKDILQIAKNRKQVAGKEEKHE